MNLEKKSLLKINNVSKNFGDTIAVKDVNYEIFSGDFVAILGPSGCGKTTLLKMIGGFIEPSSGSIEIENLDITNIGPEKRPTNMVFQGYGLFPHMTVKQNIAYGLKIKKIYKNEIDDRTNEILNLVKLSDLANRNTEKLSGGQQQRVAIARALAYKPSLLLLDEPFSNIDTQVRFELIADIRRIIKAQQVSAVFVTHSKEEAFAFADTLAVMHGGKIAQQGSPEQLFSQPNSKVVAEFLGTGIYLTAKVLTPTEYETAFGVVHSLTASNTNCQQGQVYIRPHHIQLCEAAHSDANSLTILHRRFIGTRYVYRINIAGQECEVAAEQDRVLAVEQPVKIKIMPHTVNFFHD